jgi:hypothetical protein
MPIYWRNKIYTEKEKEILWIQKIEEETRYVLGNKIDVSKNLDIYFKQLYTAREINKELGYGNDEKDWNREKYENEIRKLKQKARIQ